MKNFPFKAVNPDTGKEETFWYSRSMAAAIFVFARNEEGSLCVLANKRGPGCPDFVGCWVCPCGYLDYNETLAQCAIRECKEETGVVVPLETVKLVGINDSPEANRQNVTARFIARLDRTVVTSNSGNEEEETSEIRWIPVSKIEKFEWAFDHDNIIKEILPLVHKS